MTSTLTLWRDYEPGIARLPEMLIGAVTSDEPGARVADECFIRGARLAEMEEAVDLRPDADARTAVRRLTLVRELTANGIVVRWQLCPDESFQWQSLSHIYPPGTLAGAGQVAGDWARVHRRGQLIQRCGPGFTQVRDSRPGGSQVVTFKRTRYLQAINSMTDGLEAAAIPQEVLETFARHHLVMRIGDLAWWLPYRLRRKLPPDR